MMTSSIAAGPRFDSFSTAARMATAASSSGRVSRSVPLPALPTAVRTADTITTSFIFFSKPTTYANPRNRAFKARLPVPAPPRQIIPDCILDTPRRCRRTGIVTNKDAERQHLAICSDGITCQRGDST